MKRLFIISVFLLCWLASPILAQGHQLTKQQISAMQKVGLERVISFQDDLSNNVMNPKLPYSERVERIHAHTKLLFIDEDRVIGVTDQKGYQFNRPLMVYLRRATSLKYSRIELTFSELHYGNGLMYDEKISNERGGEWYSATVVYKQEFMGMKDGEASFHDVVERVMTVHIEKKTINIGGMSYDTYHALLGDSKVTEINTKAR